MKKILSLLLLTTFILYGCSKKEEVKEAPKPKTTDVKIEKIVLKNIDDVYTLPGIAEAWEDIIIPAEAAGPVTWVGKSEGDTVKKGEAILKINISNLQANLNTAKVQLENDEKEFIRQSNLYKQSAVSQKQYEASKRAYDLSQVNYRHALDEFNKGTIKSPVDGVIDDIMLSVGEFVSVGMDVARLIDRSRLKIYVNIPERDVKYLKEGQIIDVYLADTASKKNIKKGKIGFISISADPTTLTHKARIDISIDEDIRPGRITRADIVRKAYKDAIVVDIYSIMDKDGQKIVFINNGGKAEERAVIIDAMIGKKAVISSGLNVNDELVISGQQFLQNNSLLNIVE